MQKRKSAPKKTETRPPSSHARSKKDQAVKQPELKHIPWSEVELETLNPLFQRQFMVGHQIMLSRILLKAGCVVPLHSHRNEQISYVIEGSMAFSTHGREIVGK